MPLESRPVANPWYLESPESKRERERERESERARERESERARERERESESERERERESSAVQCSLGSPSWSGIKADAKCKRAMMVVPSALDRAGEAGYLR
jgi:hypothetical protein